MNEKEEEFCKLTSFRKCPNCGGELEKGYIHVNEGIRWDKEWHKWNPYAGERIVDVAWWGFPKIPSLRCKHCLIIVSHYGYKEEKELKIQPKSKVEF